MIGDFMTNETFMCFKPFSLCQSASVGGIASYIASLGLIWSSLYGRSMVLYIGVA